MRFHVTTATLPCKPLATMPWWEYQTRYLAIASTRTQWRDTVQPLTTFMSWQTLRAGMSFCNDWQRSPRRQCVSSIKWAYKLATSLAFVVNRKGHSLQKILLYTTTWFVKTTHRLNRVLPWTSAPRCAPSRIRLLEVLHSARKPRTMCMMMATHKHTLYRARLQRTVTRTPAWVQNDVKLTVVSLAQRVQNETKVSSTAQSRISPQWH